MSGQSKNVIDAQEANVYAVLALIIGLVIILNYHFEWVSMLWKLIRIPSLFLSDYLIPDQFEKAIDYQVSKVFDWLLNNSSNSFSYKTLTMIEQEYTWATRVLFASSLFFASYQVNRFKNMANTPLSSEEYLRQVVPHVAGEEALARFDPSKIPLQYDFKLSVNQNAFRMPVSIVPFVSCYPPIGFKESEIERPICLGMQWQDYSKALARQVFCRQLGAKLAPSLKLFPEHLRKATLVMLACFPTKLERQQVLNRLIKRHHYARTFLMGLLQQSQKKGVMPPKRFRFILHQRDRLMYLALYGVRSRLSWYEVLGIVSHFQYEVALNKAIETPMVELAMVELNHTLGQMQSDECVEKNIYAV